MMAQLPHAFVTLHVGVGTFQPVREALITNHRMHTESYELSADAASQIKAANRVISVGTTVTRVWNIRKIG